MHNRHVALSCCIFNLSLLSKTKAWRILKRVLMMMKFLIFTYNQIPKKWNKKNKFITDLNVCAIKELFVHFSCTVFGIHFSPFLSEKSFSLVEVKCLRKIFTKKIHFNWETFQLRKWKLFVWNIAMMIDDRMRVLIKSNQTF